MSGKGKCPRVSLWNCSYRGAGSRYTGALNQPHSRGEKLSHRFGVIEPLHDAANASLPFTNIACLRPDILSVKKLRFDPAVFANRSPAVFRSVCHDLDKTVLCFRCCLFSTPGERFQELSVCR